MSSCASQWRRQSRTRTNPSSAFFHPSFVDDVARGGVAARDDGDGRGAVSDRRGGGDDGDGDDDGTSSSSSRAPPPSPPTPRAYVGGGSERDDARDDNLRRRALATRYDDALARALDEARGAVDDSRRLRLTETRVVVVVVVAGARDDARGVLEHADVMIAKIGGGGVDDAAARDCASRVSTVWASLIRSRGDAASARDATTKAMTFAASAEDATSARAMEALMRSRECAGSAPWGVIERALGDISADEDSGDASRAAALAGARTLASLTRFRIDDAFASAERCAQAVVDDTVLESAKSAPHGWAVATALKTLGHVERMRASDDDAHARAFDYYTRALEYATDISVNESPGAMASRVIAEELIVDCRLALAQLLISAEDVTLAETHAARAVSGAEALGDDKHPCVGVSVAVSGDVYVAKALRSASGTSVLGDGAGVMFAEGLYRNAIKLMHYPHMVEDAEIVLDYEARHLCALLHARYSSVLRASGEQRRSESDAWLASAKLLWPDERARDEGGVNGIDVVTSAATKLGTKNGIQVLIDLQQMTPLTVGR